MPLYMKITPLTVYREDNTIFNGIIDALPTTEFQRAEDYEELYLNAWNMDGETLISNLLLDTANLNVLYTDPEMLKYAIEIWASKEKYIWQSLFETLFYKYNPIWNKDGTYKETATETRNLLSGNTRTTSGNTSITDSDDTSVSVSDRKNGDIVDTDDTLETRNLLDTNGGGISRQKSGTETTTEGGTKTNTGTVGNNGTSTTENQVSAYNATAYQNRDKSTTTDSDTRTDNLTETTANDIGVTTSGTETETDTRTLTQTGTDKNERDYHRISQDNTIRTETDNRDYTRTQTDSGSIIDSGSNSGTVGNEITRRDYGNIGVTRTQEMIRDERDIVKFNIYDYIIDSFKHKFCIMLY